MRGPITRRVLVADLDLVALAVDGPVLPVWKSNFGRPQLHLLDGVDNHTESCGDVDPRKARTASLPRHAKHQAGNLTGGNPGTANRKSSALLAPTQATSRQPSARHKRLTYHAPHAAVACGALSSWAAYNHCAGPTYDPNESNALDEAGEPFTSSGG